jgi:hypothetical protein
MNPTKWSEELRWWRRAKVRDVEMRVGRTGTRRFKIHLTDGATVRVYPDARLVRWSWCDSDGKWRATAYKEVERVRTEIRLIVEGPRFAGQRLESRRRQELAKLNKLRVSLLKYVAHISDVVEVDELQALIGDGPIATAWNQAVTARVMGS